MKIVKVIAIFFTVVTLTACITYGEKIERPKVDYCELSIHANKYTGQLVETKVIALQSFHGRSVTDDKCRFSVMSLHLDTRSGQEYSVQQLDDLLGSAYLESGPGHTKAVAATLVATVKLKTEQQHRDILVANKVISSKIVELPKDWYKEYPPLK